MTKRNVRYILGTVKRRRPGWSSQTGFWQAIAPRRLHRTSRGIRWSHPASPGAEPLQWSLEACSYFTVFFQLPNKRASWLPEGAESEQIPNIGQVDSRHTLMLRSNWSHLLSEMANATRTLPITVVITLPGSLPGSENASEQRRNNKERKGDQHYGG